MKQTGNVAPVMRGGAEAQAMAARWNHSPKVAGSSPAPATNIGPKPDNYVSRMRMMAVGPTIAPDDMVMDMVPR